MSDKPTVRIMASYSNGHETVCVGRTPLPGPYDPPLTVRDSDGICHLVEDPRGAHIIETEGSHA